MKRDKYGAQKWMNKLSLLVFLAIILATALFFVSGYYRIVSGSKRELARYAVNSTIPDALDAYKDDIGDYPTTAQGLDALLREPYGIQDNWSGPYLKASTLLDPWGNPYQYSCPSQYDDETPYDLWSLGSNFSNGKDDITNRNSPRKK